MVKASSFIVALVAATAAVSSATYVEDFNTDMSWNLETISSNFSTGIESSTAPIVEGVEVFDEAEFNALTGGRWKKWAKRLARWTKVAIKVYCKIHPRRCGLKSDLADFQVDFESEMEDEVETELTDSENLTEEEFNALTGDRWKEWVQHAGSLVFADINEGQGLEAYTEDSLMVEIEEGDVSEGVSFDLLSKPWNPTKRVFPPRPVNRKDCQRVWNRWSPRCRSILREATEMEVEVEEELQAETEEFQYE